MTDTTTVDRPLAVAVPNRLAQRVRSVVVSEPFVLGLAAIAFGVLTMWVAVGAAPVYLTPDGGHAVTDARALIDAAPRSFIYLPAWPAVLLPLLAAGLSPVSAVTVGLGTLSALLFVALAMLVRPATSFRASLVGATMGAASTPVGELLGWQGGASLLGLVAVVAALAALDRWAHTRRRTAAILVGVCFVVALAAHPFMAIVGAGLLGLRWLVELRRAPLRRSGWGPTSLQGMMVAAIIPVAAAAVLLPRYLAIQTPSGSGLRPPDLATTLELFGWVTRETPALAIVLILAMTAAVMGSLPGRAIGAGVVALFVGLTAGLSGDDSYQSRVAYLLPIPLAIGGAVVWRWLAERHLSQSSSPQFRDRVLTATAPLIAAVLIATIGFPGRLSAAVPFYSPLGSADVALITSLEDGPGAVATSWQGNQYFGGLSASWLVEGLANRAAIGPTDPALSTRQTQIDQAAAAWQLFSGSAGIENGALQLAVGPGGWRADPAIAARIQGYYLPLIHISDVANEYGTERDGQSTPADWAVTDGIVTGLRAGPDGPLARISATLDGNLVHLAWAREPTARSEPWTIWVWPAYGLPWRDVQATETEVSFTPIGDYVARDVAGWARADPRVTVTVGGAAGVRYEASEPRYGVQALAISVPAGADLEVAVTVTGTSPSGPISEYDERAIIAGKGIGSALIWRDTGWVDRFESSRCWQAGLANGQIAAFDVTSECGGVGDSP